MSDRLARQIILLLTMLGMAAMLMLLAHASCRAAEYAQEIGISGSLSLGCPGPACPPTRPTSRGVTQDSPLPGRCRVFVSDGSTGSGTLISADGVVLTTSHLFTTGREGVVCQFPSGQRCAATLTHLDAANELAALRIAVSGIVPVAVCNAEPVGTLVAGGFGGDGVFRAARGQIVAWETPEGTNHPAAVIHVGVRPGDSGGGVVNEQKQLVGVVWGCLNGQTYITAGEPLREFLHQVLLRPSAYTPPPSLHPLARLPGGQAELPTVAPPFVQPPAGKPQITDERGTDAPLDIASIAKDAVPGFHPPAPADDNAASTPSAAGHAAGAALSIGSLVTWSLKGAALLGPVGAFAGIAAWLAVWRIKKRVVTGLSGREVSNRETVVAVDSPPPKQRTLTETHYVSVEQDTFARAHQWASEQVARKYPGATEILQAQDSLIKQCLAGKNTAEAQRR